MLGLDGVIRNYAWGSDVYLARLQGRPVPAEMPEAEEWFGAHPTAPSILDDGHPLDEAVASDPQRMLGTRVHAAFGPRLPFLLKLLAAAKPLSLQAHPNLERARAGHEHEVRMGIDTAYRNYVDGNHKPEMLVALTEFRALCGFRDPGEAADEVEALGVPGLERLVATLRASEDQIHRAVTGLLALGREECRELIGQAAKAAAGTGGLASETLLELARFYPDDPGVLVSLLLNHVLLEPGEAVYMPAGNLHAYMRGFGVEIMAASDNVLRGGLTNKRVDVPELLSVLDFTPMEDPRTGGVDDGPVRRWPVPIDDFSLLRATLDGSELEFDLDGPRICLCTAGSVVVADGDGEVRLSPGRAAFSAATAGRVRASGDGELFIAAA